MRHGTNGNGASFVAACVVAAAMLAGCGGSSSGSSNSGPGGSGGNTPAPGVTQSTRGLQVTPTATHGVPVAPTHTSTPPPTSTPTLTPTPTPTVSIIVRNGRILEAIHQAGPGAQIIVPPGLYAPFTVTSSDLQGSVVLIADVTGALTNSGGGPVTINANGGAAAVALSGISADSAVILDGFTLSGGTTAGLLINGSPNTLVEDCIIANNAGDGVRFNGSADSFLFNNLIYGNKGAGARGSGTDALAIFNNTLYANEYNGISLDDTATNADVENNIVDGNTPDGIIVTATAASSYFGDYNLNADPYGPDTPIGLHDLSIDPQFILPSTSANADFHLSPSSPAIDAGDPSLAQTDPEIVDFLRQLSVLENGTPDCQLISLGYHYPTDQSCDLPTPTPVATAKKKPAKTPTP